MRLEASHHGFMLSGLAIAQAPKPNYAKLGLSRYDATCCSIVWPQNPERHNFFITLMSRPRNPDPGTRILELTQPLAIPSILLHLQCITLTQDHLPRTLDLEPLISNIEIRSWQIKVGEHSRFIFLGWAF